MHTALLNWKGRFKEIRQSGSADGFKLTIKYG